MESYNQKIWLNLFNLCADILHIGPGVEINSLSIITEARLRSLICSADSSSRHRELCPDEKAEGHSRRSSDFLIPGSHQSEPLPGTTHHLLLMIELIHFCPGPLTSIEVTQPASWAGVFARQGNTGMLDFCSLLPQRKKTKSRS